MKTRYSLIALTLIFLMGSFTNPTPSSLNIQITGKAVTINDVNISNAWNLKEVQGVLGKSKHITKGRKINRIHMYDDMGIMLYEGPKNSREKGHVKAMDVFFDTQSHGAYFTKNTYSGKIQIEGLDLDKHVTLAMLKAKLTGWRTEKILIDHWYKFYHEDIYVYFMYNDDETSLCEISIGEQM